MKTLLANLRAQQSNEVDMSDCGRGSHQYHRADYSPNLKAGEFVCVGAEKTFFVALGDSLRIEGVGSRGNKPNIGPVENAWGATTGQYKITATKDTKVNIFFPTREVLTSFIHELPIKVESKDATMRREYNTVLSLRESRGLTITSQIKFDKDESLVTVKAEELVSFNPHNAKIVYHYDEEKVKLNSKPAAKLNADDNNETNSKWITSMAEPLNSPVNFERPQDFRWDDVDDKYTYIITCDIDSTSVPDYFPDIDVNLSENTIFSDESEAYSFMTGGKLSAGVIAAIVIAVVVVVALIVILIVCYCCKCCCFKKDKSSSSSSS